MKTKPNIIINIGREVGSGGKIIAQLLANRFDCKCFDKEILNLAAKESGFSESFFERNDEQKGFFSMPFQLHNPLITDNNFYNNKLSQESLFQIQCDAIMKVSQENNCVFVGRVADYVLRDCSNKVNIFISANIEDRIKRVSERLNMEENAAKKFIHEKEKERSSYYNYYTGKRWGDSKNYDLCVNSSVLGIEKTTEIIAKFIEQKFQE